MNILSVFLSAVLIVGSPALAPPSHHGDNGPEVEGNGGHFSEVVQVSGTGEEIVVAEASANSLVLRGSHGLDLTLEAVSDEDGDFTIAFKANNEHTERIIESQRILCCLQGAFQNAHRGEANGAS